MDKVTVKIQSVPHPVLYYVVIYCILICFSVGKSDLSANIATFVFEMISFNNEQRKCFSFHFNDKRCEIYILSCLIDLFADSRTPMVSFTRRLLTLKTTFNISKST